MRVQTNRAVRSWPTEDALGIDGVSEKSTSAPVARRGRASITLHRSEHQDFGL